MHNDGAYDIHGEIKSLLWFLPNAPVNTSRSSCFPQKTLLISFHLHASPAYNLRADGICFTQELVFSHPSGPQSLEILRSTLALESSNNFGFTEKIHISSSIFAIMSFFLAERFQKGSLFFHLIRRTAQCISLRFHFPAPSTDLDHPHLVTSGSFPARGIVLRWTKSSFSA